MSVQTQEARIILAIKAIRSSKRPLSRNKAAEIYQVPRKTLSAQIAGRPSCNDI